MQSLFGNCDIGYLHWRLYPASMQWREPICSVSHLVRCFRSFSAWDVRELSEACRNGQNTRMEWLMMWQIKGNTLPYVSMAEMFRNGVGLLIVWDSPFDIWPIWLWIYTRNIRLDHRPIFVMVVLLYPCSFRDMTPPSQREWTLTRSGLMPEWWIFRVDMNNRIAVIRSVGVTVAKVYFPVNLYSQIYYSVIPQFEIMWCIRRARDLQVHRLEVKYLWCMVCPMRLLLWLVILRVADSAWRRRWSGEFCGSWQPPLNKPTSPTMKCLVRVARLRVPSQRRMWQDAVCSP